MAHLPVNNNTATNSGTKHKHAGIFAILGVSNPDLCKCGALCIIFKCNRNISASSADQIAKWHPVKVRQTATTINNTLIHIHLPGKAHRNSRNLIFLAILSVYNINLLEKCGNTIFCFHRIRCNLIAIIVHFSILERRRDFILLINLALLIHERILDKCTTHIKY